LIHSKKPSNDEHFNKLNQHYVGSDLNKVEEYKPCYRRSISKEDYHIPKRLASPLNYKSAQVPMSSKCISVSTDSNIKEELGLTQENFSEMIKNLKELEKELEITNPILKKRTKRSKNRKSRRRKKKVLPVISLKPGKKQIHESKHDKSQNLKGTHEASIKDSRRN
jgi:hypothetical protein